MQLGDIRKQQFDNQPEAGEQTLTNWWFRSQSSFHGGAGLIYDSVAEVNARIQFQSSAGVNPWTLGELSLLRSTSLKVAGAGLPLVRGCINGGVDTYLHAQGAVLSRVTDASTTAITWGGSGTIVSLADDGTNYYAADNTGIYSGLIASGVGAKIWNNSSANVVLDWAKQRLMAGIDNKIYELVGAGPALPTVKFTHPNASWVWTSFSESPAAIYAAGYAGGQSAVYSFVLDSGGAVPVLT